MHLKKILGFISAAALCAGLYLFCEEQTRGFRLYRILSNLPNDTRWETPFLSTEDQKQINALLDQPFTFLGSGGWCYAFLGADQKTVLKFYKHSHLLPSELIKDFSIGKLLLKSPSLSTTATYFQEFNFNSCMLLLEHAKDRSGLLYVHLNKTQGRHQPITLIDPIGVQHRVDLDATEFVVQKKAELLIPHLDKLLQQQDIPQAKQCIDDVIDCLLTLYQKGLRDCDTSLRQNFGFTEDGAITLDISSFVYDESLKNPAHYKQEILLKTKRLSHWLKKYHPDLFVYYDARLKGLSEPEHQDQCKDAKPQRREENGL